MAHPTDVLDTLVASGRELGAAFAVAREGEVEVAHAAGTRDGTEPWAPDTLVMTFSVAKPMAALAFLDAVAEGHLGLDQPVASVWPAFGRAGKQTTTMRHLLTHQAGLPAFPEVAATVDLADREALVDLLAAATPVHPPGAGVAEHALTYGHLLDEVLRRATGEPLADRFRRTPFPAVSLHASAVALALFHDDVARPDGQVAERLGHDLWRAYVEPAVTGHDGVLDRSVTWTLGFQVSEEDGRVELGMGGAGGCSAWTEPALGYGAAYVSRQLGAHDRGELVWEAITALVGG
ncbi:MAG: beta-lactamase family protein [Nocardioides sp.]|nr:beta-lactamase family protein [Nocardioides sp.]